MSAPGYPMPASPQPLAPSAPHDPTAVMGSRVVAGLIDALLFFLVMLLVSPGPLSPLAEYAEKDEDLSQEEACELAEQNADADPNLCFAVGDRVYWLNEDDRPIQAGVYLGYIALYIVLQGLTGWTPGKLLLGLRAVRADGQKPGIGRSFLRTLLWIVDGFPYCVPLVGLITAISSTGHRRLGDMVGGTYVVSKNDAGRPVVPGQSPGDAYLAGAYPGAPTATAPYGTPATGFPAAPPYQAPGQPPAGAWGSPPAAPGPGWGTPPAAPSGPPVAPDTAAFPASPSDASTPDVTFGAGADPSSFEAAAGPPPATTEGPRASEEPATSSEPAAAEVPGEPSTETISQVSDAEGTAPTEPTPEPATEVPGEPSVETVAKVEEAAAAPAPQQADSPYQPQWDAARGAYIQWDPNRSRWLQWDDTAKEWKPI